MIGLRHRAFAAALSLHCIATSPACSDTDKGTDTDATTTPGTTDATTTTGDGTDATTSPGTTTPTTTGGTGDPDYRRECQPGDFVCDDLGCEDVTIPDECYKPCTPDGEVGGVDSECDEPERPFCSQVGLAEGGDFSCNSCVHICTAESENWCDFAADACQ
ncbi:hypothetical protein SAMN02745121_05892 [Nannocystis exedens]|uniref:Uncharacterized protein n=1 Tax=Nannocystis exedens TaxID=54 RepID=A0A1I2E2W6_9BACT|nr:hypothetical protein [Nannocystis exedens]PCC69248.1 hypothetical protein NAEX_02270 [Nannocystis exedens]SFE87175.1 hypothetical protein SAMN02745121_05892 [Nannocystis exedens]